MLPIVLVMAMLQPFPVLPFYQEIEVADLSRFNESFAVVCWYGVGDGFHGHKTANGEIFDAYKLTFAHNSLPFKTKVKFTYNGKSVIGYCNDRGNFEKYGRQFDVSYQIAKELGFIEEGVVILEWEIIKEKVNDDFPYWKRLLLK